ncbi:4'-phosphopantetheinyl transferase superfamily protein [Breoghania sp. L-A4]|uniref:4'-phosphopantetheinyl transferase superfamily protein n=1 Tax=Breoghania sp. L-A4 TaxID=2304600 RepID=UPI000E35998B|nr:4'-phosphopantetheinyl transferase superfamily protein [Breoghania sp. L-A4]AXS40789.1 4-phosphopantetheinyl transferase family protein [Breoghania sp. L-A4]
MGVDIERIDADRIKVLRTQIPRGEEHELSSLGLTPVQALTAAWSAREALSKVLGGGLSIDMAMLALDLEPGVEIDSKNSQKTLKSGSKLVKLVAPFVTHLRVEVRVADTAALALALPRTASCDCSKAAQWLAQLDELRGAAA